jgi:hypothetical protein
MIASIHPRRYDQGTLEPVRRRPSYVTRWRRTGCVGRRLPKSSPGAVVTCVVACVFSSRKFRATPPRAQPKGESVEEPAFEAGGRRRHWRTRPRKHPERPEGPPSIEIARAIHGRDDEPNPGGCAKSSRRARSLGTLLFKRRRRNRSLVAGYGECAARSLRRNSNYVCRGITNLDILAHSPAVSGLASNAAHYGRRGCAPGQSADPQAAVESRARTAEPTAHVSAATEPTNGPNPASAPITRWCSSAATLCGICGVWCQFARIDDRVEIFRTGEATAAHVLRAVPLEPMHRSRPGAVVFS